MLANALGRLDAKQVTYATQFVEHLLAAAQAVGASDLHLQPTGAGLEIRWRLDGVLQMVGVYPQGEAADVVARLKVLAGLLTYRNDIPQEGRLRPAIAAGCRESFAVEMRVSTFPTLHGERAVVRLFAAPRDYWTLADLGLSKELLARLEQNCLETSSAIVLTGPAGSGKTTSAYACLRHIVAVSQSRRSVMSLEDPIESAVAGVAQSQLQPASGFDWATGLRSMLRQDPEVILVGEIRDADTLTAVFQAALTGHLVLSTFHAGSAAEALSRMLEMGVESYVLRSGLRLLVNQRLVRRRCACAAPGPAGKASSAGGCEVCRGVGYAGRLLLAEWLPPLDGDLGAAVLRRADARELETLAVSAGMRPMNEQARTAIEEGQTDAQEVRRVLGSRYTPRV